MKVKFWIVITFLAVLISLVVTPVLAAGTKEINWYVIAGGGGPAESGNYTLNSTIGQPFVGMYTANDYDLCSGFWCMTLQWVKIFLPIIFR